MIKRIFSAGMLLTAMVLAGCGASNSIDVHPTKTAADVVATTPALDSAAFIKLAQGASACADVKNKLWIVDGKEVFWDRKGSACPDMNWSQVLYATTPDTVLCSSADSIAGPMTRCSNDTMRALFDAIVKGADQPNLGLDSSHKVERIDFLPPNGTAVPYNTVAKYGNSGVKTAQNVVIKDAAAFDKLWESVVAGMDSPPKPVPVDFSRQMVVGVFLGGDALSCGSQMGISKVTVQDGKIVVDYETRTPAGPIRCMAIMNGAPMDLVAIDRSDAPVQFVSHQVELMLANVLDESANSGINMAREIIVDNQSSFEQLWADHAGKDKPAPQVDFDKKVVLGIFGGPGMSCNGLVLDSITRDDKQVTVNYFRTMPPLGVMCTALAASPGLLVAIDRGTLPIVFHKDSKVW